MIIQLGEWQSYNGKWYAGCEKFNKDDFKKSILIAFAIGFTWSDFVMWIITNFKPSYIKADITTKELVFYWDNYYACHNFTTQYNKLALEKNISLKI